MFGKLNQEWQGVPAGTEVEILQTVIAFGDRVHECRRTDGTTLPGPYGARQVTRITANFIEIL